MKLFGIKVPLYRRGVSVFIKAKTHTAPVSEKARKKFNPKKRYEWPEYLFIAKKTKGEVVSVRSVNGLVYYGVVVSNKIYVVREDNLTLL